MNSLITKMKEVLPQKFNSTEYDEMVRLLTPYQNPINIWGGSVLCLILEYGFFIIKRSQTMPTHGGDLAMVGGHKKTQEIDPWEVCLREFHEETQLDSAALNFLGYLPPVYTAGEVVIVPCAAHYDGDIKNLKSNGEWHKAFFISFDTLASESKWLYGLRFGEDTINSILHFYLNSNDYKLLGVHDVPYEKLDEVLWGATARIVWNFLGLAGLRQSH